MKDELKAAIEAAKDWKRVWPASQSIVDTFLATHGDALIASVELAEAVLADEGADLDDPSFDALQAYRATKERRGS